MRVESSVILQQLIKINKIKYLIYIDKKDKKMYTKKAIVKWGIMLFGRLLF